MFKGILILAVVCSALTSFAKDNKKTVKRSVASGDIADVIKYYNVKGLDQSIFFNLYTIYVAGGNVQLIRDKKERDGKVEESIHLITGDSGKGKIECWGTPEDPDKIGSNNRGPRPEYVCKIDPVL